jgi:hypothetical protein
LFAQQKTDNTFRLFSEKTGDVDIEIAVSFPRDETTRDGDNDGNKNIVIADGILTILLMDEKQGHSEAQ